MALRRDRVTVLVLVALALIAALLVVTWP